MPTLAIVPYRPEIHRTKTVRRRALKAQMLDVRVFGSGFCAKADLGDHRKPAPE